MPASHPFLPRPLRRLLAVGGLLAAAIVHGEAPPAAPPFRLGFSAVMFTRINENDAKAAISTLAAAISREQHLPTSPMPRLFTSISSIRQAYADRTIDAVGMTLPEYWALQPKFRFIHILVALYEGVATENYILLTRADSSYADLASLGGRRLSCYTTSRTALASYWLDLELVRRGLPAAAAQFATITETSKSSKAVLDVFFGQTDACLTSQRAYQLVTELNPNVARSLRVIALSPALVPSVLAITDQTDPVMCGHGLREISRLHESPGGRQVLTMMRLVRVAESPMAILDTSLALLDDHARLCPAAAATRAESLENQRLPSAGTP